MTHLEIIDLSSVISDLFNIKNIEFISEEHDLPAQRILRCSNKELHNYSSVELAEIFSYIPESLTMLDISNNQLCRYNTRNTSDYLYQQENKLWSVCQYATNVQVLNIAGNELYRLPVSSFQKLSGEFNMTTRLILGFTEFKLLTMVQVKALAEMFPNLEKVELLGLTDSVAHGKNPLLTYFESFMPKHRANTI